MLRTGFVEGSGKKLLAESFEAAAQILGAIERVEIFQISLFFGYLIIASSLFQSFLRGLASRQPILCCAMSRVRPR